MAGRKHQLFPGRTKTGFLLGLCSEGFQVLGIGQETENTWANPFRSFAYLPGGLAAPAKVDSFSIVAVRLGVDRRDFSKQGARLPHYVF